MYDRTFQVQHKKPPLLAVDHLLELLDLQGCTVTIDAMGCQIDILEVFTGHNAGYVIATKGNQGTLLADLQQSFAQATPDDIAASHRSVNKGHGRIDIRQCRVIDEATIIAHITDYKAWSGLRTLVEIHSERRLLLQDKVQTHTRYFISSLPPDAKNMLHAVRTHWHIENSLHWRLDMAFREDESRVCKDHAPRNFAIMRQIALNLLTHESSIPVGTNAKRKRAGWDHSYLLKVLCAL